VNVILHFKPVLVIYVASFPGPILLPTIEDGSWVGSEEDYFSHLVSTSQLMRPGIGTNVLCSGWLYESYTTTLVTIVACSTSDKLWWFTAWYETSLSRRYGSFFMHVIYMVCHTCAYLLL